MIRAWVMSGLMGCCFAMAAAQSTQTSQSTAATDKTQAAAPAPSKSQPQGAAMETAGEQKFQQNCSRCHNAPQELSPRISGTVVMHMRVRASLSDADAKAILRFLAP